MFANLLGWEVLSRVGDERVDRAIELIISTVPIQTIVTALIANQPLCELLGEVSRRVREILFLRRDQIAARFHGGEFISADAPEYDLVFHCVRVEIPRTVVAHQG